MTVTALAVAFVVGAALVALFVGYRWSRKAAAAAQQAKRAAGLSDDALLDEIRKR